MLYIVSKSCEIGRANPSVVLAAGGLLYRSSDQQQQTSAKPEQTALPPET